MGMDNQALSSVETDQFIKGLYNDIKARDLFDICLLKLSIIYAV